MIFPLCLSILCFQAERQRTESPARVPAALEFAARTELRLHSAGHLTGQARLESALAEFARPAPEWTPAEAAAALDRLQARRTEVESITRGLLETLRDQMQPALGAGQRIECLEGGRLALLGDPEQQAWLERFLVQAHTFDGLIDIQARIYEVERGKLPEAWRARGGAALPLAETRALLELLEGMGAQPTIAPRLVAFPFQEAHLKAVEQTPYVKDFEVKVLPAEGPELAHVEVADPVIDVVEDGLNLTLRGVPVTGGRLAVYARLDYSHVARPIRSMDMALASGVRVTLQRPDVTHVEIHVGRFELAAEQSLLLVTSLDGEEGKGRDVLVLLQARGVPAQADEGPEKR